MICVLNENKSDTFQKKVSLCGKELEDSDYVFSNVGDAYECATSKTVKICPKCKEVIIKRFKDSR